MIVPAFILAMQEAGLGQASANGGIFWEEFPQWNGATGLCVISRADAGTDNNAQQISLDILAMFNRKMTNEAKLRQVINWVRGDAQDICQLSINPHDLDSQQANEVITYDIISIEQTATIVNQGLTQSNQIIKGITVQIKFNERSK